MQSIDRIICEMCLFTDHCNGIICLANEKWHSEMREALLSVGTAKE